MGSFLSLLCIVVATILAVVVLGRFAKPDNKKDSQSASVNPIKPKRTNWIWYFAIALIVAFWTTWGALFFLAMVWAMRLDPKPYSNSVTFTSDMEKKTVRRIYTWLLFSSIFTVPFFLILVFVLGSNSGANERALTALIPLIFHIPLLLGLTSKSHFVFRHTQQGMLLIALRAGMAALAVNIGSYQGAVMGLFLIGNGSLWLFGTLWGRNQVIRGECWLMKQRGEKILSAESAKAALPQMDKELDDMLKSLDAKDNLTTRNEALQSFRTGSPEIKKRAVEVLSKLGEVEKF